MEPRDFPSEEEEFQMAVVTRLSDLRRMVLNLKNRVEQIEKERGQVPDKNGDHIRKQLDEGLSEMQELIENRVSASQSGWWSLSALSWHQVVAWAFFLVVIVIGMMALASQDIPIPFVEGDVWMLATLRPWGLTAIRKFCCQEQKEGDETKTREEYRVRPRRERPRDLSSS